MGLHWRFAALSDPGTLREINEDSGYASPQMIAVADGMGGAAAGEIASQTAIEALVATVTTDPENPGLDVLDASISNGNARIRELVADDPTRSGMGTTLTALLWTSERSLAMAHIGDSRAYRLRGGELSQLTHDHTFVQSLIDEGRITAEQAKSHPARALILKALQGEDTLRPDLEILEAEPGDILLLCSDGLDNADVSDEVIAETLRHSQDLGHTAERLVNTGLQNGAPDNVTVVLAEILDDDNPNEQAAAVRIGAADDRRHTPERASDGAETTESVVSRLGGFFGAGRAAKHDDEDDADPEELRYAPRPRPRWLWVRRLAVLVIVGAIAWLGFTTARAWMSDQYFVADSGGEVAIYRGLNQQLGPVDPSELYAIADGLPVEALPPILQNQLSDSIAAEDVEDAQAIVQSLREEACALHPNRPGPTPSPTPGEGATDGNTQTGNTQTGNTQTGNTEPGYPGLVCPQGGS
ncbi:MAG TPA: protein phosphatase 2C domain-containing protein [Jiangellaceae bacterium]|nr:protein phosphatase 2C domain-containing protein [Jiangellaceae bacterium]